MDLEAIELVLRASLHQAGATALTALLQIRSSQPQPAAVALCLGPYGKLCRLTLQVPTDPCGCSPMFAPYYLCDYRHHSQFPVDADLDIEDTELSPGVRRMMAAVGHEAAFNRGREQLKLLAGLTVTTKAVERTAEAIGAGIERRQQQEHKRAMQLELPIPSVGRIPILYVEMDGRDFL